MESVVELLTLNSIVHAHTARAAMPNVVHYHPDIINEADQGALRISAVRKPTHGAAKRKLTRTKEKRELSPTEKLRSLS